MYNTKTAELSRWLLCITKTCNVFSDCEFQLFSSLELFNFLHHGCLENFSVDLFLFLCGIKIIKMVTLYMYC